MRSRLLGSLDAYTDGRGCISKDDLVGLLVELGQPVDTAEQIIDCTRLSKDGQVDYKDFVCWTIGPPPPVPVLPALPVSVAIAQHAYRNGLLEIGSASSAGKDIAAEIANFVESNYAFGLGSVIFKTTNGHERFTFASRPEDARKYFTNPLLQFVADVKLENESIVSRGTQMFAQGRCVFTLINDMAKVVDFTFGYEFDVNGRISLFLHHSCDATDADVGAFEPTQREAEHEAAEEIAVAQEAWASGLMQIAAVAGAGGDCVAEAEKFVDSLYSLDSGPVLFKTFAPAVGEVYFAKDRNDIVKYFGNPVVAALTGIRFENMCSITKGDHIFVRGNYHFTTAMGTTAEGEYLFGYERGPAGALSIFLQHSSTPFL